MINNTEATAVYKAIQHLDGRTGDENDARLFAASLNTGYPQITAQQALQAISEWYAQPHAYSRIMPGDITGLIRAKHPAARLDQTTVSKLLNNGEGLEQVSQYLTARRELVRLVNQGVPQEQAGRMAYEAGLKAKTIEPPKKPKQITPQRHFAAGQQKAGDMKLTDILGTTHAK